jgi:polar amino acid transport system substrate-binding protein
MFLAGAVGALSVPAHGLRAQAIAPEIARVLERGRLVVAALAEDLPPFLVSGAAGAPAGRDVVLAEAIAKALGVAASVERRARNVDEIAAILSRHEADIALSRLSASPQRALKLRFSRPYLVLQQALLLNRPRFARLAPGRDPLEVVREPGVTLAVTADTAYPDYAQLLLPEARLRLYPRWEPDLVEAVMQGDVVAGYGDELEVRRTLAARPEAPLQLRSALLPDQRDPVAIALPWDSPSLAAWLDLYLQNWARPVTAEELLAPAPGANLR